MTCGDDSHLKGTQIRVKGTVLLLQRWEFIKKNKKVRNKKEHALDEEHGQEKRESFK